MPSAAAIQPSRTATRSSRSERTPSGMLDPVRTACSGPSRHAPTGQPEARGPQDAEGDRGEEHDAVRAQDVVDDAAEPRADGAAQAVAEAQRAIDHAEAAPAEEVGGHRGDDGSARAEAQAEQEGICDQPSRAPVALEGE